MTADEVTIVVLNWSRGDETVGCLESLARASLGGASILVVDNGSRDGSVAMIRARFPDQPILELPENRGYAAGNNAGMRAALEAGARGVLLLNNDTRVRPDFLIPLLWAMNDEPRAGAVSSAILREDCPEMLDVAYSEVHFDRRSVVCLQGVNTPPGLTALQNATSSIPVVFVQVSDPVKLGLVTPRLAAFFVPTRRAGGTISAGLGGRRLSRGQLRRACLRAAQCAPLIAPWGSG